MTAQRQSTDRQSRDNKLVWCEGPGIAIARAGNKPVGHVMHVPAARTQRRTAPKSSRRRPRVWSGKHYVTKDRARSKTRDEAVAVIERAHQTHLAETSTAAVEAVDKAA